MGIPYSKQIHLAFDQSRIAFDQVTPLVAHGFKVLQTTRNITYAVAAIQVLTVVFLGLILITLLALIITVSPDLEYERKELVTPVVRWLADVVLGWMGYGAWFRWGAWIVGVGTAVGAAAGWWVTRDLEGEEAEREAEEIEGEIKEAKEDGS
ncbi:uncharacterized protein PAC_05481 [Phialocephala subalpina]|uniref:Uncharacterized protein n=1 Tax=Phialocephala subalpina TaxID=576137 RepID=A0A1L7WS56_9HELO|nr:uncharacterized protein PAC_05481 [Phialocephala subalpina]